MLLYDLQKSFESSVLRNKEDEIAPAIKENNLLATQRLQIYRNNIFSSLTEALTVIFPKIQILIGEECFAGVAREYIYFYISQSGDVKDYGAHFANFLQNFSPLESVPYLSDMARLEWACHEVFHEKENELLDLNRFHLLAEDQYENCRFELSNSSRLIESHYPIFAIWRFCQNTDETKTHLDLEGNYDKVLIIRRQNEVLIEKLSDGEFAMLVAFKEQKKLRLACELALNAEPNLNISECLQGHLLRGTIINFDWKELI